jgi:hypothetical protein
MFFDKKSFDQARGDLSPSPLRPLSVLNTGVMNLDDLHCFALNKPCAAA